MLFMIAESNLAYLVQDQSITESSSLTFNMTSGFTIYENFTTGIMITYPLNWTVHNDRWTVNHVNYLAVKFFSPNNGPGASLVLSVHKLSDNLTLYQYSLAKINEISRKWNDTISPGKFKLIQSAPVTLDQNLAYRLVYECPCFPDLASLKRMEIWTLKNGKIYDITFETFPDKYNDYLNTAEKMINSFKIIN